MTYPEYMAAYGRSQVSQQSAQTRRQPSRAHQPRSPNEQRPLRAVHVGPCFSRGGAEQQIIDLAHFFDPGRVRIERCIATIPELVDPAVVADMPAPVEVGGPEAVRRAARECDVMLCWGIAMDDWLAQARPGLCVFLAHGDMTWTRDMLVGSRRVIDHVIAVSHRVREQVCDGYPTSVILNGVDSARLGQTRSREDVRASLGFAPGDFVLGYVGRFSPEKRAGLVLQAAANLPPRFKTLLVGWGPQRNELIETANALIPGRFAFVTANHHLGDYYQSLDALCLLSDYEGFALVMLEAMMCERPVMATPVGSAPEFIVDRVNGIVVDGNVASVCRAAELLDRHPHWARAIAREGKAFAQQHGHAWRMARQYEELLERLWAEKNGSLPSV
jgi:glycosyltransferase involved in cell wall biosynthesis